MAAMIAEQRDARKLGVGQDLCCLPTQIPGALGVQFERGTRASGRSFLGEGGPQAKLKIPQVSVVQFERSPRLTAGVSIGPQFALAFEFASM